MFAVHGLLVLFESYVTLAYSLEDYLTTLTLNPAAPPVSLGFIAMISFSIIWELLALSFGPSFGLALSKDEVRATV